MSKSPLFLWHYILGQELIYSFFETIFRLFLETDSAQDLSKLPSARLLSQREFRLFEWDL